MTPRFRSAASVPEYIGAGSVTDTTGESGNRKFPSTADGSLEDLATYRDLATGERWYFSDGNWRPVVTTETLILEELRNLRQAVDENRRATVAVLGEVLETLQKIA